jgi:hypothetical protein
MTHSFFQTSPCIACSGLQTGRTVALYSRTLCFKPLFERHRLLCLPTAAAEQALRLAGLLDKYRRPTDHFVASESGNKTAFFGTRFGLRLLKN